MALFIRVGYTFYVVVRRFLLAVLFLLLDFPLFLSPPFHRVKVLVICFFTGAKLAQRTFLHSGVRAENWNKITIGSESYIAHSVKMHAGAEIVIGCGTIVGPEAIILSRGHVPETLQPNQSKVHIGDRVFIGARAVIIPGITVHDDAVIGAGAVVTKDVPENAIVAGNPAKLLRYKEVIEPIWTIV